MDEDDHIDRIKNILNVEEYQDTKKELRQFLFEEIKNKNKLDAVKKRVTVKWNKSLNNLEHDYIDRKFIKYCTQFWLDDIHKLVIEEIKNKKCQELLMTVDYIKEIKNIPKLFQISDYYEILISQNNLIQKSIEEIIIHKIKLICLQLTVKYNATAKKELEFISHLASFLDKNYNNQDILDKLDLKGFVSGKVSFEIFLNSIIRLSNTEIGKKDSDIILLTSNVQSLQNEKEYTLLKKIEEIVGDFLKPIEVHEKALDGRIIIEIKSRNIKVSEIINNVESLITKNSNITEIHFVVSKNFYIDTNLSKDIWHGKNIGILTSNIQVINNVTWDVSGRNNEHKYESDGSVENDGRGKDGSDGYPGESGGNVLILAKSFLNEEYFSIISNGGNGSDGQNGGTGSNGTDGEGISRSEFKEKFPSVIKFASSVWERIRKVKEMVKYIKYLANTVHCEWYTDRNDPGGCDVFLEVTTSQGNHITFSYCRGGLTRRYQGFLLYKGSLGKPGKAGGKNGLGGEGGFPGIIEVKSLQTQEEIKFQKHVNKGATGKTGKVGSHGKHGKNSWDMGYIDYQFWGDTVVYDSKESNINIVYYQYNSSNRVWCPYKDACNRYSFAEMDVQKIKHAQEITYEDKERTDENIDRQHSSKAIKKKSVLVSNLYNSRKILELDESNKYIDITSQIKEVDLLTVQAFSNYENKPNRKLDLRSNMNKVIDYNFSPENKKNIDQNNIPVSKFKILKDSLAESIPSIFINLTDTKMFIDNVQNLKKITVDINNLNFIYKNWTKCKSKLKKTSNTEKIELIFFEKYRITVLQEIAQKLYVFEEKSIFCGKESENKLSPDHAIKYLSSQNKKFTNIYHNDLGPFRQYIFGDVEILRETVIKYCQTGFLQTQKNVFGDVFSKYFLEIHEKDIDSKDVKNHLNEYHAFLNKKKQNIIKHYNIFKSEISKFRHRSIMQTILSKTIDENAGNDLKNEIEHDPFLSILYKRFKEQFQTSYDWEKFSQDKKKLNDFFNFIKRQGSQARCYRELLAHIFDVNMRVYCVNSKKEFDLLDSHNSSSSNIIYFLYKNDTFCEIGIDSEYLTLNKNREFRDALFYTILSDVYAIDDKKTLLEYLAKFNASSFTKRNIQLNQIMTENIDEENEIDEISKFFPINDREQVKSSLQKIVSSLIGHSGIVRIILRRFQYEGRHVSLKEIRYLVNVILSSCLNNEKQENTLSWIIATAFQNNWMAEIILLELESFFRKRLANKSDIRVYLSKLNADILAIFGMKLYEYKQKNIAISSLYVGDLLCLLSKMNDANIDLADIELSEWLYILKEHYWINKIVKLFKWKQRELESVSYYILVLDNLFGMSVVNEFFDILAEKNMLELQDICTFDGILQNFVDERWILGIEELQQLRMVNNLSQWVAKLQEKFCSSDTERDAKQLVNLIRGNSNTSPNILEYLPHILSNLYDVKDRKYFVDGKIVKEMSENDIKNYVQQYQSYTEKGKRWNLCIEQFEQLTNVNNLSERMGKSDEKLQSYYNIETQNMRLLDIINTAIKLKRGFQLRDTQLLTIMSFLLNKNNTLAQVSTGEGKSLIVVAISIVKALQGEKVDIVTSSSVLAMRDSAINKDIYDLFDVSVGHNCSEIIQTRKESYSSNKVIYGDLSSFQRDYLLDRFYGENILGDHDFSNIIIDEVDSMLLDKGNNTLYLSHDIAGLNELESVYVYIWCTVNRPIQDAEKISDFMNISKIKESVLYDIYGILKKKDLEKLDKKIDELKKIKIWNFLVNNKVIENNGRLIVQNIQNVNLNKLSTDLIYLKENITYMLRDCIERQRYISVPKCLNYFVDKHLESWIKSAFAAFFMKAGHDYVVDVDRTKTISDRNPIITIIDRATGTDQLGSQWDNALHQFLQLKHGCKLTTQSLKAIFISNVSYFKLYRNLYGLTGTLGSERERNLLKEIHKVDFVTVPTAKSICFHEYIPIVCKNKDMWINSIHKEVVTVIQKEARSILIICQFVEDVELIKRKLINMGIQNIYTYTRDYEEFDIVRGSKKLKEGQIIIATNLAGRGTDIILTDTLIERGGLHVCLAYLPTNTRIEKQAFGRAARCGDKGTGRLIVVDGDYQLSVTSKVLNLKKERDAEELRRISSINVQYKSKIKIEEKCFDKFKTLFDKIKSHFTASKIAPEVKDILLQCCLDSWAFWLDDQTSDRCTEDVNCILNESFQLFYDRLKNLVLDLQPASVNKLITQKCFDLVKQYPIKMIILAKYFAAQNNFSQALAILDTVINNEKDFSGAAHYYKSFVISKQINWEYLDVLPLTNLNKSKELRKMFKKELLQSARLFQDHAERSLHHATIIEKTKENHPNSIIQIQAYTQQQQTFSNLYNMFVKSVDDILGGPITFQNFCSNDINELQARDVYDNLLTEGFLNQPKVRKGVHESQLRLISQEYGISTKVLQSFLEKYENSSLDVNIFIKDIKNRINLPSCGNLWKILLEKGILFNETKYVIVDTIMLNKIDPSFLELLNEKVASGNLRIPNTDFTVSKNKSDGRKILFVSGICIKEQMNENTQIFYKSDFKDMNQEKYLMLKRKGALSFNKMAHIDESKISRASFARYDSITLEDFSKINISKEQAAEILSELISEGIIEENRVDENQFIYQLTVHYENIFKIKLESKEVYKTDVIGLLWSCFAFRIAVQKLQKQLNEKVSNIRLQVMYKPHYSLFYELIEHKIIKNVKVTNEKKITEESVKDLFGLPISKEKIIELLKNSGIIPTEKVPELFDNLVSANWIQHCNVFGQVLHGKLYEITTPDEDQGRQSLKMEFRPFQKSIEMFLNYRSTLGTENSVRTLTKTLNQSRSSIKSLSVPDNTLKPLTEYFGSNKFLNVNELHVMSLNGLDHIQHFEEKRNTTKMIVSTAIVSGLGLIQLAIGVVILYFSIGFMTHIGSILISEGISDMLYATSAIKSGYFSWNDYLYHKVQSLIFSAITVGVGALFSWGVRYSRFGYKLFGPALQETCGKELLKKTGTMVIVKSISTEALKGIAICAANYGADALIERHLKSFCENVGTAIRSNIETEVDSYKLSSRLEEVYQMYGESNAKKALCEITESFFYTHNIGNNILPTAMKISNSIVKGVKEATNKKNSGNSGILLTVNIVNKILLWTNRAKDLYMVKTITEDFVNELCKEIDQKLIYTKDKQKVSRPELEYCQEKYEDFKKEITENWKRILREQSGRVISQNIVSPILEDCLNELITFCGRKIKDAYRYGKETHLESELKKLRQQFKKNIKQVKSKPVKEAHEREKTITSKYHKDVLKLLEHTKNPRLFANMIRENIPMDLTCALASGPAIEALLKERGIVVPGLSIIFNTEEGIKQEVLLGPKNENKQVVVLNLKKNHYQISGTNEPSNSNFESAENDCLYQALAAAIPELRELGPTNFRTAMAKQIEDNPEIRRHIENGWHKYPIHLNLVGGAKKNRRRSSRRQDPESTDCEIKDPVDHIFDRFIRLFRVAGTVQRISADTGIPPDKIVREGASEYQDRNSNLGSEYHSAHIVRAVIDNCIDPRQHAKAFVELKNILGHTQIVPRFLNEYHGVGGVIDRIQGDALRMASLCDFNSGRLDDRDIFNSIKNAFVLNINNFLYNNDKLTESNRIDIEQGLKRIYETTPSDMYKSGHQGFSSRYRDAYM